MMINREEVREMFYHGFDSYMEHAFPHDELRPISCTPRWRSPSNARGDIDDNLAKSLANYCSLCTAVTPYHALPFNTQELTLVCSYSLTLVDSLDTLAVISLFTYHVEPMRHSQPALVCLQWHKKKKKKKQTVCHNFSPCNISLVMSCSIHLYTCVLTGIEIMGDDARFFDSIEKLILRLNFDKVY